MPEIPLTQYLRPDGRKTQVMANVSQETYEIYERLQPVLSCETTPDGLVVIYGRLPSWTPEKEIVRLANNGPENGPTENLEKLIKLLKVET